MTSLPDRRLLPERAIESLSEYVSAAGGQALAKALTIAPERIIADIKRSGLRGRGGGGFSTGVKWASVAHDPCPTKYLVCNGAEGEPGTFKDRYLMRKNPYQLLEGIAIAAYAINAKKAFLGIKKSFEKEYEAVSRALAEMSARGHLGPPQSRSSGARKIISSAKKRRCWKSLRVAMRCLVKQTCLLTLRDSL
jgi:NADH-quinone oxidoreductase subunit F